ncbi:acetolactate synthase [Aestuariicoccus sp. KMU-90]|uniref:Acetolactate synthase n=1 Tax=Thetidibacter halocola TaxID=2827239 RepID=A0A8J8BAH1_9RHOB|nr:acetolactate synthase [Thetidibacter halocola]
MGLWTSVSAADTGFGVPVPLDSGLDVTFHDVIRDVAGDGLTYRFRFVVPGIGDVLDYADVVEDIDWLCNEFALPRVPQPGPQPNRIVISMMSEPTEFGVANPDVTQFFESFSIQNGLCIWEAF